MEVKTISIDWNNDFFNNALLVIHVNKLPQNLYIYEQKENIYFAVNENNGLVSFFYEDPKDHNGYDGEKFILPMKDGSTKVLIGPWASRPAISNSYGFPFCTLIIMKTYNEVTVKYMINSMLEGLIKKYIPELKYYIAANGEIFIPKNQPLNKKYHGSYSQKRNKDIDPPKYNPQLGISENYETQ